MPMPPIHHHPYHHHQQQQSDADATASTTTTERSSKRKIFQCKGFGNCSMVFTRSEHLARHTRKHTGEKPYKCVVPGCNRMFSRFDNMMQHTQTHQRNSIIPTKHHHQKATAGPAAVDNDDNDDDDDAVITTGEESDGSAAATSYNDCGGLMSPVSLGSPDWNHHQQTMLEEHPHPHVPTTKRPLRRLSATTDLCNPAFETIHLTLDEFEALEGFARFREAPLFYESLRNLASVACIEPRPYLPAYQQENCL